MIKNRRNDDPIADLDALNNSLISSIERMINESRAIDTRKSLEGIKADRTIRRSHKHSVSHKSYR